MNDPTWMMLVEKEHSVPKLKGEATGKKKATREGNDKTNLCGTVINST